MNHFWPIAKIFLSAGIIVAVSQLSQRFPRAGALLLSLPLISLLAMLFSWQQSHDLRSISVVARDTLVLVPLSLPFFVPLAFAERWGLGFWSAFSLGLALASVTTGSYLLAQQSAD